MTNTYSVDGDQLTVVVTEGPAAGAYTCYLGNVRFEEDGGVRVIRLGVQTVAGAKRMLGVRVVTLPGIEQAITQTPMMLRRAREAIAFRISLCMESSIEVVNDAHERETADHFNGRAQARAADFVRQADIARAELAAFDALHAEIIAEDNARRADMVQRAIWA